MAGKMDQREFNATVHRWLDGLAQSSEEKASVPLQSILSDDSLDLPHVLERLGTSLKLTTNPKTSLQAGGTHLSVLARGLATYLHVALDNRDLEIFANNVHTSTTLCLLQLLGLDASEYSGCAALYHDDVRDGIVRVLQMSLYRKFEKYAIERSFAITNKPPVVYVSAKGEVHLLYQICVRVGLPMSCVSVVPCSSVHTASHTMDIELLERMITDDINQGKTPLFIVAYAGTPLAGHVDDLLALRKMANRYNMWLHVTGHALSSLCFPEEQPELNGVDLSDSLTLFPATWFGLHSCPMVTLHRHPNVVQTEGLPTAANFPGQQKEQKEEEGKEKDKDKEEQETKPSPSSTFPIPAFSWNALYPHGLGRLLPLTLWMCVHCLGRSALLGTVEYCRNLISHMMIRLDEIPGIRRIAAPGHTPNVILFKYWGGGTLIVPSSLKKLFSIPLPTSKQQQQQQQEKEEEVEETKQQAAIAEQDTSQNSSSSSDSGTQSSDQDTPPATPPQQRGQKKDNKDEKEEEEEEDLIVTVHGIPLPTANMYNMMISREMQSFISKVGIATYDLGGRDGICFRFDPIRSFPEMSTSLEEVEAFTQKLRQQAEKIHAVALARCLFEVGLRNNANLRWMEFPSLHCVSVLQYVPSEWLGKRELTLAEVDQLNKLNLELSRSLSRVSDVFGPFQHGNFSCILVKDLPPDMSMYELLEKMIIETRKFEDHKKFLQGMSDKIRVGIEAAKQDITKEKEKLEQEEGILRHLPLVGSVLNWWSPVSPTAAQGRSFNLTSGKVAPTAEVYKNKMMLVSVAEEGQEAVSSGAGEETGGEKELPKTEKAETNVPPPGDQSDKTQLDETPPLLPQQ